MRSTDASRYVMLVVSLPGDPLPGSPLIHVIFAQRMTDPVLSHENAAKIGMAFKADAHQVPASRS